VGNFFQESIDKTLEVVKKQFQILKSKNINCEYIYLVGGYAKSVLLQEAIKDYANKHQVKKVIVPEEPGGSVLWGGVCYGFDKNTIRSRYSALTYGINISMEFREGIDPESKRNPDNTKQCKNRFDIFVVAGDVIKVGHKVVKTYVPIKPNQTSMRLSLYTTHKTNPQYIDEEGVRYAGATIEVPMPNTERGLERQVEVTIIFGNIEIKIEAEDLETHQVTYGKLRFDFNYLDT
jgi:molecular chaperone DnaK (HSP70)